MKKTYLMILLLLLSLALAAMSGCGQEPAANNEQGGETPGAVTSDDPASTVVKDQDVSKLKTKVDENVSGQWFISNTDMYGTETAGYCQLTFNEDGTYTQLITETLEGDKTAAGTWTIATGQLTLITDDRNVSYDYEVSADQLILSSGTASLTFTHTQP